MATLAVAVSLFLPLLVASREASRRATCRGNLRTIGIAWNEHESALGFYPSSGWDSRHTGDPELGFGAEQPGGWLFDAVAFTEFDSTRNLGFGLTGQSRIDARLQAHSTPLPFINCPARRPAQTFPLARNGSLATNLPECRIGICRVIRTDYQANSGNINLGDSPSATPRGVTHSRSEIRSGQIADGLSKTLCVGEKYLNADAYYNGNDAADDHSAYVGFNRDVNGYTASASVNSDPVPSFLPRRDRAGLAFNWTFGSAHSGRFNALFCDTSVREISYNIDHRVFWAMGGRNDGSGPFSDFNLATEGLWAE